MKGGSWIEPGGPGKGVACQQALHLFLRKGKERAFGRAEDPDGQLLWGIARLSAGCDGGPGAEGRGHSLFALAGKLSDGGAGQPKAVHAFSDGAIRHVAEGERDEQGLLSQRPRKGVPRYGAPFFCKEKNMLEIVLT